MDMKPEIEALAKRLQELGGCGNGGCVVWEPLGMHTNAGCKCSRDPMLMNRVMHAYRPFHQAAHAIALAEWKATWSEATNPSKDG